MRFTKVFRLACLSYLGAIAAGNFIPDGCAAKKVVVATKPAVPVEEIAPTGDLGEDTERLNALHPEYKLAGNDLCALTRGLYFEDAGDRLQSKAFLLKQQDHFLQVNILDAKHSISLYPLLNLQ